jgi:Holliday junction DNA helicase RuvA
MFNSIRGIITEKSKDALMILTGGIEWEFTVPTSDIDGLPSLGEEARVFTWLYHREDLMRIFAFANAGRRSTFLELLKVEGIGPKQAIRIMGGISQEELERALDAEDVGRLEAVPGLGKKTAQKMILALKGKLARESGESRQGPHSELTDALADMGYDRRTAADAIARAETRLPKNLSREEQEKFLFKEAIFILSGS